MIQIPRFAAASAIAATADSSISAPVGFEGEFRMIAFVFGVIAARILSACTANESCQFVWTMTGVASTSLTCSGIVGQYGAWVMTSSPGFINASAAL